MQGLEHGWYWRITGRCSFCLIPVIVSFLLCTWLKTLQGSRILNVWVRCITYCKEFVKRGSLACENGHYFNAKYRGCNNLYLYSVVVDVCDPGTDEEPARTKFLLNWMVWVQPALIKHRTVQVRKDYSSKGLEFCSTKTQLNKN